MGRFDVLRCDRLLHAMACKAPSGDHVISGFDAICAAGEVHFFITRKPRSEVVDAADAVCEAPTHKAELAGVQACDVAACTRAARALASAMGADALGGVGVRCKAACYELFSNGVPRVSDAACALLAPWPASFVNFERRELVCVVDRERPDL